MSVYHRIRSSRDNPIDNDTSLTDYQLSLQYILQPEHGQQQEEIVVEMPPHPAAEHSPVRVSNTNDEEQVDDKFLHFLSHF